MKDKLTACDGMDTGSGAHILADHPVLDMLNTGGVAFDGQPFEFWHSDEDVVCWLKRTDICAVVSLSDCAEGALLEAARKLRKEVRVLVAARKAGEHTPPEGLNVFLAHGVSYPQLEWHAGERPCLTRVVQATGPERILLPLAEGAAALLVQGNFDLIRQCEHEECVYWFYDMTKGHRRRWCSMALCGNRHKVAQYRKRHAGGA